MSGWAWWASTDAVGRAVALLLLGMSVASWVLILWKLWLLPRAARDLQRAVAAFWQAPSPEQARAAAAAPFAGLPRPRPRQRPGPGDAGLFVPAKLR